jgi:sugar lactone lactonase YvrE
VHIIKSNLKIFEIMSKYTVEIASKHVCDLGEGPHWDEKSQSLYYVDFFPGDVCCLDTKTQESQIIHVGDLTSIVIPVSNKREEFIITQSNKLFKFNWITKEKQLLAEVEKSMAGNRFNDGKCDSKGRLWIGTLGLETDPGVVDPDKGSIQYSTIFIKIWLFNSYLFPNQLF